MAFALALQGEAVLLIYTTVSALLHELGHARAAYTRGYVLKEILLMPYGAVLFGAEKIEKKDALLIATAGIIVNALIILAVISFWWIFPSTYTYTEKLFYVNAGMIFFNMLPIFPLDGGRVVLALAKNEKKALRALRITGIVTAIIFFVGFLVSFFFKLNFGLGIAAVMLFVSSTGGTEREAYANLASVSPYLKNHKKPLEKKTMIVDENARLIDLVRELRSDAIITFEITDNTRRTVRVIEEKELSLIDAPLNTELKKLPTIIFSEASPSQSEAPP